MLLHKLSLSLSPLSLLLHVIVCRTTLQNNTDQHRSSLPGQVPVSATQSAPLSAPVRAPLQAPLHQVPVQVHEDSDSDEDSDEEFVIFVHGKRVPSLQD